MKKSEITMRLLDAGHGKWLGWNHYMVSVGYAWAIVATLQFNSDGDLFDWVARVGGCDWMGPEEYVVCWVAEHGHKLSLVFANAYFPDLPIEMYRS